MNIAILDGVVIAVVFISAVLAMFRGFVREVLSIAAWVAAAVLAYLFYGEALPYVQEYVTNETLAIGLAAAGIFLVALIVVSLITMKISDFVMDSPVGAIDRLLGFVFGAARGVLLVVVAVVFFNLLVDEENRPPWVTTAASYPRLTEFGEELLNLLPDDPEAVIRGAFDGEGVPGEGEADYDVRQRQELDQTIDATRERPADDVVIEPRPFDETELEPLPPLEPAEPANPAN